MNTLFGKNLKELRKEKELTQANVALIFNVSKTTICQWETSKQEPSLDDIINISKFYNVTTDFLLGLEDNIFTNNVYDAPEDEQKIIKVYRAQSERNKKLFMSFVENMNDLSAAQTPKKA